MDRRTTPHTKREVVVRSSGVDGCCMIDRTLLVKRMSRKTGNRVLEQQPVGRAKAWPNGC